LPGKRRLKALSLDEVYQSGAYDTWITEKADASFAISWELTLVGFYLLSLDGHTFPSIRNNELFSDIGG
jgi:hypothetical protein